MCRSGSFLLVRRSKYAVMIHTIQSDIAQQFSPVLDITTGTQCSNNSIYLSNNDKAYNTPPVIEGNLQLCWSIHGGVSLELPKRIENNKLYTWAREPMPSVCHYLFPLFHFLFIFDRFCFVYDIYVLCLIAYMIYMNSVNSYQGFMWVFIIYFGSYSDILDVFVYEIMCILKWFYKYI